MKYSQKKKLTGGLLIIIAIFLLAVFLDLQGYSDIPERKTIDVRTRLCRDNKKAPSDIVIVMLDEASLNDLNHIAGKWPWPRNIHAELIDFLKISKARAVIMDIMFLENEIDCETRPGKLGINDSKLVASTRSAKNIFHSIQITEDKTGEYGDKVNTPMPDEFSKKFSLNVKENFETKKQDVQEVYNLPFKELYNVAKGVGVVSYSGDDDGVFRSDKLLFNYQGHFFASLSLAPFIDQFQGSNILLNKGTIEIVTPDFSISIPLTKENEYYVNMYGDWEDSYVSYGKVYESILKTKQGESDNLPVSPEEFNDKIVFIGTSAAATYDAKHTSLGSSMPGVFLHASTYGNIIESDYLNFVSSPYNFIIILILLCITVFSIFYLKTSLFQIATPLLALIVFYLTTWIFFEFNIVLYVALPSFAVLSAYLASYTYISFTEGREKRKITNILGQYVSPTMLSTVLATSKDEYLKAEVGTKETLTIFFSDIRSFTTISEKYEVEKVVEVLNSYLSEMVNIIFNNKGTLDKFIGDAVVAFWGAPIRLEDQHYKAVISAIQMIESLGPFNIKNQDKGLPEFKIGIGIHTGDVILGNIGSEKMLDYTVIGDSVNLTSRLEGLTKFYKCSILISQDTYEHVQDKICCRIADYVRVKGKDTPIMIYEVIGEIGSGDHENQEIAAITQKGFKQYKGRSFKEAINTFEKIQAIRPDDHLSGLFIERCKSNIESSLPDTWDGSYSHKTK